MDACKRSSTWPGRTRRSCRDAVSSRRAPMSRRSGQHDRSAAPRDRADQAGDDGRAGRRREPDRGSGDEVRDDRAAAGRGGDAALSHGVLQRAEERALIDRAPKRSSKSLEPAASTDLPGRRRERGSRIGLIEAAGAASSSPRRTRTARARSARHRRRRPARRNVPRLHGPFVLDDLAAAATRRQVHDRSRRRRRSKPRARSACSYPLSDGKRTGAASPKALLALMLALLKRIGERDRHVKAAGGASRRSTAPTSASAPTAIPASRSASSGLAARAGASRIC